MKFRHQSRAIITVLKMNKKYCSIIQIYILSISMNIHLTELHKLIHRILRINKILTSIKGHNSVKNWRKITCIRHNMDLVFINAYTKSYQNSSIYSEDIDEKHIFTSIKGHKSVVYEWVYPIWIPNLISMSMQSLKKIGQKLLKLESRNDIFKSIKGHNSVVYKRIKPICNPEPLLPDINVHAKFEENRSKNTQVRVRKQSADGRMTDTQTFKIFGGYNIIPHHFLCGGV